MDEIVRFSGVRYAYQNQPEALCGIALGFRRGTKVAVVGPNGAGKTTLLLMCNGTLRPTAGEVLLDGSPIRYSRNGLTAVRQRVGMVFQNSDMQVFAPTVWQDVAFGPVNLGLPAEEVGSRVSAALDAVGLLGCERRPPHHLSGGEKKRVAIAGILSMHPEILILDEPTSNLDPATAAEIMDLLDDLSATGTTIVISTHDVDLAYHWAEEVVLMEGGEVLYQGEPRGAFEDLSLMNRARLTLPPILEVWHELAVRGITDASTPPAGIIDLLHQVEQSIRARSGADAGNIVLCDATQNGPEQIRALVTGKNITRLGAMGTRAKMYARENRLAIDFTYGVIDKCLMRAMIGENSLIIASPGMIPRVRERVAGFCRDYGILVDCVVCDATAAGYVDPDETLESSHR